MKPLQITDYTLVTTLGQGVQANLERLQSGDSGLAACHFYDAKGLNTFVGEVGGLDKPLEGDLQDYDCRNNRLAKMALEQDGFTSSVSTAIEKYGPERVAIIMGTSTSGIHHTELAYIENRDKLESLPAWYHYQTTHNISSIAHFTQSYLGAAGHCTTISTACSSSAKVFASASRAIELGLCDAVIVGGVDSLCLTTLYGFNSLQLVSNDICRPCDENRDGLSIGEAGGFALVEPAQSGQEDKLSLLGYGESSDAYHMSSPHPEGDGALIAMESALAMAGLTPEAIDYINLHGTGTPANDLAETNAIARLFGSSVACSSTKGWTGHTLGAAGIIEVIFGLLAIEHQFMPCNLNIEKVSSDIKANILRENEPANVRRVLTNSFGFGGSNCSLILGAVK